MISGNCARRAFENIKEFSEITYFPEDLLDDYYTLLMALSCDSKVSPELFDAAANDWMDRFFSNPDLNWNWFSVTVHLVLGTYSVR